MAFNEDVEKAEKEEMKSQEMYNMMAREADRMEEPEMARELMAMAWDEGKHAAALRRMHTIMHPSPEMTVSLFGTERYYWQLDNKSTGEIVYRSDQRGHDTVQEAVADAKSVMNDPEREYAGDNVHIKVFTQPPDERDDTTAVPVYNEMLTVPPYLQESAKTVLGRISQSLDLSEPQSSRILFPRTTGDWSDLAGRIKDFDPQNMSLRGEVNRFLSDIYDDEDGAADSKRKLFDLAIGFGIS